MRRWLGSLYWASEDNETEHHFIANFNVEARMRRDAMKAVLDEHWDDRLDSASCYPVFKWKQRAPVLVEVSNAEAIAISNKLGEILQAGNRCVTPALYSDALRDVEAEFGIGSVVLALRQIVGFLQRELDYHARAEPLSANLIALANAERGIRRLGHDDSLESLLSNAVDYLRGLSQPIQVRADVQVPDQVADRLKLQPKTELGAVSIGYNWLSLQFGKPCSICGEIIAPGEAAVRDGDDFAHLCCSVLQADGDDIDREHGAS